MNTMDVSGKQNKSDAIGNTVSYQNSGGQGIFEFVDNRKEAVTQRKLETMIKNSSRMTAQQNQVNSHIPSNEVPLQRATAINYGGTKTFTYEEGGAPRTTAFATSMEAHLDKRDIPDGSGPPRDGPMVDARNDTKRKKGGSWVLGHLLNQSLGGPGEAKNLAPITWSANGTHYNHVEDWILGGLGIHERYRGVRPYNYFDEVDYVVNVNTPHDWSSSNPWLDFETAWKVTNPPNKPGGEPWEVKRETISSSE